MLLFFVPYQGIHVADDDPLLFRLQVQEGLRSGQDPAKQYAVRGEELGMEGPARALTRGALRERSDKAVGGDVEELCLAFGGLFADSTLVVLPVGDTGGFHRADFYSKLRLRKAMGFAQMFEPKARRHGGRDLLMEICLEVIYGFVFPFHQVLGILAAQVLIDPSRCSGAEGTTKPRP